MTVNQRIKILREVVNLSQSAFAESIGTTRSNLAQIEQDRQLPTLTQIRAIVLKYNTSYDWLSVRDIMTGKDGMWDIMDYGQTICEKE